MPKDVSLTITQQNTGEPMTIEEKLEPTPKECWQRAKKIIKEDIVKDPNKIGYKNKKNEEILDLLNNPIEGVRPARIYTLLIGVPFAPNAITLDHLTEILGE